MFPTVNLSFQISVSDRSSEGGKGMKWARLARVPGPHFIRVFTDCWSVLPTPKDQLDIRFVRFQEPSQLLSLSPSPLQNCQTISCLTALNFFLSHCNKSSPDILSSPPLPTANFHLWCSSHHRPLLFSRISPLSVSFSLFHTVTESCPATISPILQMIVDLFPESQLSLSLVSSFSRTTLSLQPLPSTVLPLFRRLL